MTWKHALPRDALTNTKNVWLLRPVKTSSGNVLTNVAWRSTRLAGPSALVSLGLLLTLLPALWTKNAFKVLLSWIPSAWTSWQLLTTSRVNDLYPSILLLNKLAKNSFHVLIILFFLFFLKRFFILEELRIVIMTSFKNKETINDCFKWIIFNFGIQYLK